MSSGTSGKRLECLVESVFEEDYDSIAKLGTFRDLENWDSLKYLKLIVAVQAEFGIELGPEEIMNMTSVPAIAEILKARGIVP